MAVPAKYREWLADHCGGRLVATIDTQARCLMVYPLPEWNDIEEKIQALPSFNPKARRTQRLILGHASDLELDGNGRVLLPPMLRKYASLEKKLVLVGQGKKFELWSDSNWSSSLDEWLDEEASGDMELPDEMATLSL